jgi:hypothetical protein
MTKRQVFRKAPALPGVAAWQLRHFGIAGGVADSFLLESHSIQLENDKITPGPRCAVYDAIYSGEY